jgi:hypothetical protein
VPVAGDIATTANGRKLAWETSETAAWRQSTETSFTYSKNTYKFDRNAGFLDTIEIFSQTITEETLANLVRFHLLSRPNVAQVFFARAQRDPTNRRDWTVTAAAQLRSGEIVDGITL